jgi:hypothetical protein
MTAWRAQARGGQASRRSEMSKRKHKQQNDGSRMIGRDWPNCTEKTAAPFASGWSAYSPGMPEEGMLCPRHGHAYEMQAMEIVEPTSPPDTLQ